MTTYRVFDDAQVALCDEALAGDEYAMRECVRALRSAAAMEAAA